MCVVSGHPPLVLKMCSIVVVLLYLIDIRCPGANTPSILYNSRGHGLYRVLLQHVPLKPLDTRVGRFFFRLTVCFFTCAKIHPAVHLLPLSLSFLSLARSRAHVVVGTSSLSLFLWLHAYLLSKNSLLLTHTHTTTTYTYMCIVFVGLTSFGVGYTCLPNTFFLLAAEAAPAAACSLDSAIKHTQYVL